MPLKQVKFTVDFVVNVEDITDEEILDNPSGAWKKSQNENDPEGLEKGRRERRLLHALIENPEVFQKYINRTFVSLMQGDVEQIFSRKYPIDGSYEAIISLLKPVVESLPPEDRDFLEKEMEAGEFGEDGLFFSTFNLDVTSVSGLDDQ